jgi:anti-sigma factor RsiW
MHPADLVLNDYVDEALTAAARLEVEQHLASCAPCRTIVEELREIRTTARSLDPREPPARAWPRIERAIKLEWEHATDRQAEAAQGSGPFGPAVVAGNVLARLKGPRSGLWLAAAAAILVAVGIGFRYVPRAGGTSEPARVAPATDAASADAAAVSIEAELRAAEEHYQKAITGLEQIANAGKGSLDTQTAATLQKNLAVIDQAISESRAAVRAQPASEPAQQSLMESFKAKLALLQDTVALINEMRKGNEAGAARVGSGLRQKG